MKVEAGKTYISVDGSRHGPMIEVRSNPDMFVAKGSLRPGWDEHGKVYLSSYRLDLVAEHKRPKLWRDMTDAEKGAILLAKHEGKEIEGFSYVKGWVSDHGSFSQDRAYRIKTEPKVVKYHWTGTPDGGFAGTDDLGDTHMITFNTINGKPDLSSVKMEKI